MSPMDAAVDVGFLNQLRMFANEWRLLLYLQTQAMHYSLLDDLEYDVFALGIVYFR